MTSATDRRLKRVEEALYPTEAMALWLQEAREQHRSLAELVESLKHEPEEAWPLFRLTHQAETSAKGRLKSYASLFTGLKGQRTQFLERTGRDAVRDTATLWFLFVHVNERFLAEKRALWLLIALLTSQLRIWVHKEFRPLDEPLDRRIASCLDELYTWREAVAALSEQYFQGVNPLMPDIEEHLANMVAEAELLAERFNDSVEMEAAARKRTRKRTPKMPGPIDLKALRDGAQPAVQALVRLLVDMARGEAHEMMGERRQALAFAERHL